MIEHFSNHVVGRFYKISDLKWTLFSKKRATDLIFFLHFFLISLPVLAIPEPDVDPTLVELRSRFIQEIGAQPFDDKQKFPLEIRGDYLGLYGLSQDKVSLYKPDTPTRTSTLVLRIPKEGYLDRQGLYHGYRLLFGDGYLVPSMLVQFKDIQNNKTWILEVLPQIKPLPRLEDLKDHYSSYSLGAHFLGSLFFPRQSFPSQSFNILGGEKIVVVRRGLGPQDRLEAEVKISISPFFLEMRSVLISGQLKNNLKKQKANYFIPHWLSSLSEEEKRAHALGHTESLHLKEQTLHTLATRFQKMIGLALLPSDLSYGEIETLTQEASISVDKQSLMGIKALSLLILNQLFFSHEQQDWTEVFEILGETFETYGGYFTKQSHRLKDPSFLKQALQKNRKPSVLIFMLQGGLQPRDLGETLAEVVRCSGQRLDTPRALAWIKALAETGAPLEYKNSKGDTALDLAFQQNKHKIIEALIEIGAGAGVNPHLIIDYLRALENRDSFSDSLDLLEFRNHRLRWQLTLESLFPLHAGQEQKGLIIRTTDGQRMLFPLSVPELWKEGKIKPENFRSFTETSDPTQKKYGRHTVGKITNGRYTLYVKQYPELPGIEEAVGMLTRQLLGYGSPNTLLANISGTAYLFSEGVPGRPLQDYLTGKTEVPWSHVSDHLDPESLSGMILLAMLTKPEDGKPDNYMVQKCPDGTYRIIGIDNDHAFVPSVVTVQGKRTINVKSILFALDHMKQELHPALKRKFLYHNPRETLEVWIKTLMERSKQYEALFTPKEVMAHFEGHESFLGIALHPSIVVELYKNMSSLQQMIESEKYLTHMNLLRSLHKSIYLRYNKGHEHLPKADSLERFTYVDGSSYNLSQNKEFQTLSTGANLLSTNMMITTQKDLFDYVNKKRGQEIRLDSALETLREIAEQDAHLLAEQAMNQAGAKIPLEQMTDPQRESFLQELDWSKLPIANQQALLDQIAKVSWGDSKKNLAPWRGILTFKNCQGFTESTFLTKGFDQKMNWENIHEVRFIVDSTGGKEAYLKVAKALQNTQVPLKIELWDLWITDKELDLITTPGNLIKLTLTITPSIEDRILREHAPNLVWKDWLRSDEPFRSHMRKVIVDGLLELNFRKMEIQAKGSWAHALAIVLKDKQLQTLDLSESIRGEGRIRDVEIKTLAIGLKDTQLQTLNLGRNNIGDEAVKALAAVLKYTQLQTLSLSKNQIEAEGARALAIGLKDSKVQTLDLSENTIGDEGARALAIVLKDTQLQTLNLFANKIGAEGARELIGLKDSKVQTLDLSENTIGAEGARELAIGLKDSKVQTLDLSENTIGDEGARALAIVLKDTQLQTLNLFANEIGAEGAKALAMGLKDTQLQTLNLSQNTIGDEGARALAIVLKDTKLKTLDLGNPHARHTPGNNIRDEGACALAAVLKDTQLQTLNLSNNKIGDEGAKALAAVLKDTQLQTLNVSANEIGAEGARELAIGLKDSKVQTLNLSCNRIGGEGAKALAVGLKDTQLHTLNLWDNHIGDEGAKALAIGLKDTQLQTLNLSCNRIGVEGAQALAAVLKDTKLQTLNVSANSSNMSRAEDKIKSILSQNREKYRSLQTPRTEFKTFSLSQEDSLESLLSEAGLRGSTQQNVFRSDVARAKYMLEQGNPDTYPTILKILEQSLNPRMKFEPKAFKQPFALKGALMGLEEEAETDALSSTLSDSQESLSLLSKLSQVYPRALLSLVESHHTLGNRHEEMAALSQALKHQIPGTLEKIESLYNSDGSVGYALLMAENYLQGYMSPQNLDHGEAWLRAALEKEPTNPDIQTQLAQVLLEKGGLEDTKTYTEIQTLLTKEKEQDHGGALSLSLMIQELQNNRKVRDLPLSQKDQLYTAREQRLLRALHQSQFGKPEFEVKDLTSTQKHQLEEMSERHQHEREKIMEGIECAEGDLTKSSPLDKPAIEEEILKLKKSLSQTQEKQHQEIKRVLFPKGITSSPVLKQFYEGLSISIRQQLSLLDAIEGGLADRKEKFSEKQLKDAIASAVGYAGNMIISNIPIPASGILAMVVEKVTSMGIDKITEILQKKVSDSYDAEADKERKGVRDVTQNYKNNSLVANGLSALYVYRLQNMILSLTEKGAKDLSTRLSASVVSYLLDKKRITNPQNLTQLMVMSFYHDKGISVGEVIAKARGTHGLKKTDGTLMAYVHVFSPLIETTDGAQYQVLNQNTKKREIGEASLQIVPLIEKEILQNKKLQGMQTKLEEKRLPQLSPFQVEIIREQDDTDYVRKALDFAESLYGERETGVKIRD